jgi:hypothetical protein
VSSPTSVIKAATLGRASVLEQVDGAFVGDSCDLFEATVRCGLGGTGKTTIETKAKKGGYETILRANAENHASVEQIFTNVALQPELVDVPQANDHNVRLVLN